MIGWMPRVLLHGKMRMWGLKILQIVWTWECAVLVYCRIEHCSGGKNHHAASWVGKLPEKNEEDPCEDEKNKDKHQTNNPATVKTQQSKWQSYQSHQQRRKVVEEVDAVAVVPASPLSDVSSFFLELDFSLSGQLFSTLFFRHSTMMKKTTWRETIGKSDQHMTTTKT